MLRDNAQRTKPKMPKTANGLVGQQDLLSLLHPLNEILFDKNRDAGGWTCGNHVPQRHRSKQASRGRVERFVAASAT